MGDVGRVLTAIPGFAGHSSGLWCSTHGWPASFCGIKRRSQKPYGSECRLLDFDLVLTEAEDSDA